MNIGIIEKSDFFDIGVLIKKTYENSFKNEQVKFITINDNDLIDILILDNTTSKDILFNYFQKLHQNSIVIVNIDNKELIDIILKENFYIITFGFNPKATITISSFITGNKDTSTFCIQRDFTTIKENAFSEQEFIINSNNISEFDLLLSISTLLVLSLSIENIQSSILEYL